MRKILKNDSKFHYVFDAFQRIVEVKDQSQNLVAKYQMDTSNRRISKTIGTTVHRTVYAGWQVAEEHETAPSGKKFKTTTKVYVYGQYIDEPLVMQVTKPNGNQKKFWYLRNQQYSIYALTNDNGKIVETYHYSAYGEVNIEDPNGSTLTESAYANTYFYTGRLLDSETNLYYFRNRYYNANQGRFISRDPLGYVDGMSLYRGYFVVQRVDPRGYATGEVTDWKEIGSERIEGPATRAITGNNDFDESGAYIDRIFSKRWRNVVEVQVDCEASEIRLDYSQTVNARIIVGSSTSTTETASFGSKQSIPEVGEISAGIQSSETNTLNISVETGVSDTITISAKVSTAKCECKKAALWIREYQMTIKAVDDDFWFFDDSYTTDTVIPTRDYKVTTASSPCPSGKSCGDLSVPKPND